MQAVIDAGLFEPLVQLLQNAEFDIKKEAAWAVSNATSGGTHDQIKYGDIILFSSLLLLLLFKDFIDMPYSSMMVTGTS